MINLLEYQNKVDIQDSFEGLEGFLDEIWNSREKNSFYSENGKYGAILVQTDFGTIPLEGYESLVDMAGIELSPEFESFDLSFDENAFVQDVEFQDTDQLEYFSFDAALSAIYQKF